MARHFDRITDEQAAFIARQPLFFVATAAADGRINLSPKGLDGTLAVLGPDRIAFLNLTGSGNETAAHLKADGRITLMFCSFDASPLILRLYGRGRAVHRRDPDWPGLDALFPALPGKRQIVVVEVASVITSCGFGVPMMSLDAQRPTLPDWAAAKGEDGIRAYWRDRNATSFDGLPTGLLDDELLDGG
jgi:hypothetical protein